MKAPQAFSPIKSKTCCRIAPTTGSLSFIFKLSASKDKVCNSACNERNIGNKSKNDKVCNQERDVLLCKDVCEYICKSNKSHDGSSTDLLLF